MNRAYQLARTLRGVLAAEQKWIGAVPGAGDAQNTPWMPFQVFTFIAMAAEALKELEPDPADPGHAPRMLEIGAGIGTKMTLAQAFFGLDVHGFDRTDAYAAVARESGLDVLTCDALAWPGYDGWDLIWFNRVYRDPGPQVALEHRVWTEASPGAVVMCANLEGTPPRSWWPVLDSWEDERRGIWQASFAPGSAGSC